MPFYCMPKIPLLLKFVEMGWLVHFSLLDFLIIFYSLLSVFLSLHSCSPIMELTCTTSRHEKIKSWWSQAVFLEYMTLQWQLAGSTSGMFRNWPFWLTLCCSTKWWICSLHCYEMRRPLIIALVVTRDLFRLCVGKRVTWGKFFVVGFAMTICGMALPALIYPYPLNTWRLLSQPIGASSYNSLNSSMHLSGVRNGARLEQTLSIPVAPVVSTTSSTQTAQSASMEKRQAARRRRRRRHIRMMPKILSPPPPPPRRFIPSRLQVKSVGGCCYCRGWSHPTYLLTGLIYLC